MEPTWNRAINFVLAYEGGYVNDPNDAGGETNFGISKKAYPSVDINNLTRDEAVEIYKRDYWGPIRGDELPPDLAIAVFDAAVNQGIGTAARLLQISLDVDVDGKIGPKTILAAYKSGRKATILFLLHRAKRYMKTNGVEHWGGNWGERLIQLFKVCFEDSDKEIWI